jgi:hypothetical protein
MEEALLCFCNKAGRAAALELLDCAVGVACTLHHEQEQQQQQLHQQQQRLRWRQHNQLRRSSTCRSAVWSAISSIGRGRQLVASPAVLTQVLQRRLTGKATWHARHAGVWQSTSCCNRSWLVCSGSSIAATWHTVAASANLAVGLGSIAAAVRAWWRMSLTGREFVGSNA